MILDYSYNSYSRKFDVSYIEGNGSKQILSFNVNRFKAYYSTPSGSFTNWAGDKCDIRWVEKPSKFEIKTFLTELDSKHKALLNQKTFPKVYSFDIEVLKDKTTGEYADASVASGEISVISVTSPELNTIVLGTLQMSELEKNVLDKNFNEYVVNTKFFKTLKLNMPYVKYVQFATEEDMLKYFLTNIVAKVPILTGWNCVRYDWQYICNRIKNYFPNLSVKMASCTRRIVNKAYTDKYGNQFHLPMPEHTLIVDMMEIIEQKDKKVMPMKESMKLDYVAGETLGIHKIEYTKSLDDLYESDYGKYIFYNAIDSFIVQLINYRFKTLDSIYLIALYCNEKISNCFGSIAITEALVFNDFYKNGLKIVYEENNPARGKLVGAYVKKSVWGVHNYVCCNDFASLYPSTIRTCNISFENYVGAFWDLKKLEPFRKYPKQYLVIGPNVFENEKQSLKESKAGRLLHTFLDEEALKKYRNPNYFVTVNGCVYKNDKNYSFRRIQAELQVARNRDKYLGKDLDAQVLVDIQNLLDGRSVENTQYSADVISVMQNIGLNYTCTNDFLKETREKLLELENIISKEVVYLDNNQKAMKDIMNAMYGGASHISFYWYNMNLANDITGEARNLTHLMEHHIPDHIAKCWPDLTDVHKQLGITVSKAKCEEVLKNAYYVSPSEDPDAYHKPSFVLPVYGDTDSLYISYNELVKTIDGYEKLSVEQIRDIIVKFNTGYLDKHNKEFINEYYKTRYGESVHNFELETLNYAGVWLNVKKKYAQLLLWHDKKVYNFDNMEMKNVGLEMKKPSYPKMSRKILSDVITYMLKHAQEPNLIFQLNAQIQKYKALWETANIDDICANMSVNGYTKYIISDKEKLIVAAKCPPNVRAMANYNSIMYRHNIKGENLYSGKMKMYKFAIGRDNYDYFAYPALEYPKWAKTYAPVDRNKMFQDYVLDPLNRILEPAGLSQLNCDGSVQFNLF